MNIVLFGKNGQVGWELQRALSPLGKLTVLDRSSTSFCGDLSNLEGIAQTIRTLAPDVIVNAAAYTAVDKAESERDQALLINAKACAVLAREAAAIDAWLVHYSSDYVFDGSGTQPWQESDQTSPVNYYGKSKLEGEQAIIASGCKHLIFRTSWVYSARGNNFIKTILRLASERETLRIIADQVGVPTGAELLADVTAHAIRGCLQKPQQGGLYHLTPSGETNWFEYATFILEKARMAGACFAAQRIIPISSEEYLTPAARPLNSRLNNTKLAKAFCIHLPEWKSGVDRALLEILGKI